MNSQFGTQIRPREALFRHTPRGSLEQTATERLCTAAREGRNCRQRQGGLGSTCRNAALRHRGSGSGRLVLRCLARVRFLAVPQGPHLPSGQETLKQGKEHTLGEDLQCHRQPHPSGDRGTPEPKRDDAAPRCKRMLPVECTVTETVTASWFENFL